MIERFLISLMTTCFIGLLAWQVGRGGWAYVILDGLVVTFGLWLLTLLATENLTVREPR